MNQKFSKLKLPQSGINLFPLASILKRGYSKEDLSADLRTGFNVAVLSFPVNMAYALVAGLPISYGIYSGIVASILGLIFCKGVYITFGPSNATAVMLLSSFAAAGLTSEASRMAAAPCMLLLIGLFMVFISLFKLTFLISYISRTVIIGYVTSSALLIFANQMRNLLGFKYAEGYTEPVTLVDTINATIHSIGESKPASVAMAILTLIIFLPLKKYAKKLPAEGITLILVGIVCFICCKYFAIDVERLTPVSASEWNLSLPDFDILSVKNAASFALAVALLGIIEAFSIGKSLASQRADRLDTNQEVFALGTANIACALTSSTMASGSMTRSTLAVNSGVRTTVFNLFTAIFTLIILLLFGDAIAYVPKSTLALIVVYTSVTLIKPSVIKLAMKSTLSDAIVFITTFSVGVFSTLDSAIYTGIIVSIMLFLKKAAKPEVVEYSIGDDGALVPNSQKHDPNAQLSIVHVEGNMFFGASDVLQNQLRRIAAEPNLKVLLLKLRNAINFDATSVMDLEELARRMKNSNRILLLCEVREDIMRILKSSGADKVIGEENIFANNEDNPTLSAALAIKYARNKLNGASPTLTIYATKEEK